MPRDRSRDDAARLWDMLQHARELVGMAWGRNESELDKNPMFRRAVERLVEIIGEAAHHVSQETRTRHPEIFWKGIEAQRHVLAHEYGEINYGKIWRVVTTHVPERIRLLEPIVPSPPPDPLPEPQ